jgi:hypothetical protein
MVKLQTERNIGSHVQTTGKTHTKQPLVVFRRFVRGFFPVEAGARFRFWWVFGFTGVAVVVVTPAVVVVVVVVGRAGVSVSIGEGSCAEEEEEEEEEEAGAARSGVEEARGALTGSTVTAGKEEEGEEEDKDDEEEDEEVSIGADSPLSCFTAGAAVAAERGVTPSADTGTPPASDLTAPTETAETGAGTAAGAGAGGKVAGVSACTFLSWASLALVSFACSFTARASFLHTAHVPVTYIQPGAEIRVRFGT